MGRRPFLGIVVTVTVPTAKDVGHSYHIESSWNLAPRITTWLAINARFPSAASAWASHERTPLRSPQPRSSSMSSRPGGAGRHRGDLGRRRRTRDVGSPAVAICAAASAAVRSGRRSTGKSSDSPSDMIMCMLLCGECSGTSPLHGTRPAMPGVLRLKPTKEMLTRSVGMPRSIVHSLRVGVI